MFQPEFVFHALFSYLLNRDDYFYPQFIVSYISPLFVSSFISFLGDRSTTTSKLKQLSLMKFMKQHSPFMTKMNRLVEHLLRLQHKEKWCVLLFQVFCSSSADSLVFRMSAAS